MAQPRISDLNFLVVDDERMIVEIIAAFLQNASAKSVQKTVSSLTALNLLTSSSSQFDCVISDHQMDPLTGLELLQKLRSSRDENVNRAIPFIILTAHGESDVVRAAIDLDVTGYLIKPVSQEKLFAAVLRAVSKERELQPPHHYDAVELPS